MYLVDTNVLSEPLARHPDPGVVKWLRGVEDDCFVSAVSIEEMRYGASRMPDGRRKAAIGTAISSLVDSLGVRLIPFGAREALACGRMRAAARASGNNVCAQDIMIAATASVAGLTVATRNEKDFEGLGVSLFNPFDEASRSREMHVGTAVERGARKIADDGLGGLDI